VGYFQLDAIRDGLDRVGALKRHWGYLYSALATALFGGVIPYCVLFATGRIPPRRAGLELGFYLGFWAWKGVEVDALYRTQASLFGEGSTAWVIAQKTLVDQFIYNPLWAAPTQTLCFLWKDCGFRLSETARRLRSTSFLQRVVVILLSTWMVWIPAVSVVYSLPSALQLPLFNLVLCFWCLLLTFVSRDPETGAG
jgi:hypothetical protein